MRWIPPKRDYLMGGILRWGTPVNLVRGHSCERFWLRGALGAKQGALTSAMASGKRSEPGPIRAEHRAADQGNRGGPWGRCSP